MIWILSAILWFGILTLRAPGRWALTTFEIALFALAAVLIIERAIDRRAAIRFHPIGLLLAGAAMWGVLQIGLARTVDVQRTLEAVLHWIVNCAAFSVALAVTGDRARRQTISYRATDLRVDSQRRRGDSAFHRSRL